ncbi:MAG: DUF2892 domain-containing protein [Hyphomicrobiaceae bacterium]|nr:DUF2892 domain-containing protein [Hyphomicrobiaceae bacterium]
MGKNVGSFDRIFRIVVGLVLLAMTPLAVGFGSPLGNILPAAYANIAWIGVVPLATALIGWCPLYSIVGLSTCSR